MATNNNIVNQTNIGEVNDADTRSEINMNVEVDGANPNLIGSTPKS